MTAKTRTLHGIRISLCLSLLLGGMLFGAAAEAASGNTAREEVFEFTQKPKLAKKGDAYAISFASKGRCDATVAIVGPDGRIVRHLASGVLGENAPPPFQPGTLKQTIEWDGKDNRGKPVPAGCKVRVSLGMKARYGTTMAFTPNQFLAWSVACDGEGNAYVLIARMSGPPMGGRHHMIRVFSREGKYLKTIMPIPGGLSPEKYKSQFDIVDTVKPPLYIPKTKTAFPDTIMGAGMTVTSKGRIVFPTYGYRTRKNLCFVNTDGTGKCLGPLLGPNQQSTGRTFLAMAPAEKHFYVSSMLRGRGAVTTKANDGQRYHCVFRYGVDHQAPDEWRRPKKGWLGKAPVFVGDLETPGDDNQHLNDPRGVATDSSGNVYVCDYGNNRVQVFDAQAKHLRMIAVERPDQIAVHRKTGEVYVLQQKQHKEKTTKLFKFSPQGKQKAVFEFPGYAEGNLGFWTHFTLDDSADPAQIWITNAEGKWPKPAGCWRVADRGDSFEKLGDIFKRSEYDLWAGVTSQYITAGPEGKWIYVKKGRIRGDFRRFNAETGEMDSDWRLPKGPQTVDEIHFGPDGLLYLRGCRVDVPPTPEYVWRVDLETGKEVPFPVAKGGRIQFPGYRSPKYHRDGFCVAPNGDVYVLWYDTHTKKWEPWRPARGFTPILMHQYGPDGKLKREDILPGISAGPGGMRVYRLNNIYIALNMRPTDKPYPELLWGLGGMTPKELKSRFSARDAWYGLLVGTLAKFGPDGGKIECGKREGTWLAGRGRAEITGLKASHVGLSPFGGGCVCPTCRFDLDGFDRVFVPVPSLSCVLVLDQKLNGMTRIGTYGGPDCQGPESAFPDPEIGFSRPSYLCVSDKSLFAVDLGNSRILRVDLGYETEEETACPPIAGPGRQGTK